MSKPFKMKGSPFQRNFGIGRTESPDAPSPINDTDKTHVTHPKSKVRMHDDGSIHSPAKGLMEALGNIDLKGAAQAALSQLPGGEIAGSGETTDYERKEDGSLKLDKNGNPIPIKTESKSESKPYTVKDMLSQLGGKKKKETDVEFEDADE